MAKKAKKETFQVAGLSVVQVPAEDQSKKPGALTMEDLASMPEVRFVEAILDPEPFNSLLLGIQAWLQALVSWGQNPELAGLEDFDLAIVATRHDPVPSPVNPLVDLYVSTGPLLVARSQKTGKYQNYGLIAPSGFSQDNYSRTTAIGLVGLTVEEPAPTE